MVEILIVVAIVSILAAVGLPAYEKQVTKTRRSECKASLLRTMQQEERYFSQFGTYLEFNRSSKDPAASKFKWFSGEANANSACEIQASATCENPDDVNVKSCIRIIAIPGTDNVNKGHKDLQCQTLTYDSRGQKGITSNGGVAPKDTTANCWS